MGRKGTGKAPREISMIKARSLKTHNNKKKHFYKSYVCVCEMCVYEIDR